MTAMGNPRTARRPDPPVPARTEAEAATLAQALASLTTEAALRLVAERYGGTATLVSSFGAESAVLLHLVASVDPALPVIFLDTGRLFPETLLYRDRLIAHLGLRDVRSAAPDPTVLAGRDPLGGLWANDPDICCDLRKVTPLEEALTSFAVWINGRKRFQAATRHTLPLAELSGGRIKVSPLASWTTEDIEAYRREHALPPHPLVAQGYASIGCTPCTSRVAPGEDPRAGRWRGRDKTECGIHRLHVTNPAPRLPS